VTATNSAGTGSASTASTAVTPKATQTITFNTIPNGVVGGTVALNATVTSGLAISYGTTTPSVCTVSGTTASLIAQGTCTITADQSGSAAYTAATQVSRSFTVNPTPVPVLSFTQAGPLQIILGNSLTNAVSSTLSGGSYGAVTYTSSNPAVATVDAAGKVTTVSAGTVTITATQAAVVGVNVQATQSYSLTVNPTPVPVLSFTQAGPLQIILGNSLTNAVSSTLSGGNYGAVTYTSSNPAVATVDAAGKVTTVSAGTVTITATQAAVVGVNVQATQSYSLTVNPTPVPVLSFTRLVRCKSFWATA
jgi:hypothetical protein